MRMSRRDHGFTLIELLVTLALVAIVATVAVPSFSNYIANQRVKAASQELFVSLNYARSEAIKRNGNVRICPIVVSEAEEEAMGIGASVSCVSDWSAGFLAIAREDESGDLSLIARRRFQGGPGSNLQVQADSGAAVVFQRSGRAATPVSFTACDSAGRAQQRVVSIEASGRPLVTLGGDCS